jgi:hypothetical protein
MKLYRRVNRLAYLREVSRRHQRLIRWALGLKPGDLINDCSMFNVVVNKVTPKICYTRRGWFIYGVDFWTEIGGCSLLSCGVEPPLTPEELERRLRDFYEQWDDGPYAKGGWDFKSEKDEVWTRLQQGLPICDERGRSLGCNEGR